MSLTTNTIKCTSGWAFEMKSLTLEVPQPSEPATPVIPDAPVTPIDPDPGTPADPGEPSTVPGPEEPATPVVPEPSPGELTYETACRTMWPVQRKVSLHAAPSPWQGLAVKPEASARELSGHETGTAA